MVEQLVPNMKRLILEMFSKIPGLKEGYCLPPRWFPSDKIIRLNQIEKEALEVALNQLEEEGIIKIDNTRLPTDLKVCITKNGIEYLTKLNFEETNIKNNTHTINIANLQASHVQVGNENIMNINLTPDEFLHLLKLLDAKSYDEKKSIFEKLSSLVKSGLSLGELLIKMKELL